MKRLLVVRVGRHHNRYVLVLSDYEGVDRICPELMKAIQERLKEFGNTTEQELDYIEILGRG